MGFFHRIFMVVIFVVLLPLLGAGCPSLSKKTNATITPSSKSTPQTVSFVRGNGDVTLVEYGDMECPYSKEFHETLEQIMPKYEEKIRWEYKHFPLNQHMKKATLEAEAAECAGAQGKFWEYLNQIYERTPSNNGLEEQVLFDIANELKLDQTTFNTCIADATYHDKVKKDATEAQERGALGTPFSVLVDKNGQVVEVIDGLYSQQELQDIFSNY
ncbi:MAG: Periplasmic thiol:disulfide interchange protein DsbA [Candidatus Uhrbacteria bacterium GW2011_GWF2_41_16]|uniref:Periplasmic thiol:disulfide interchange protein DsbA n=2 Tax=Candidatus Uhriibacteriota TaxID=1752732 RepID=A0A0G0VDH8_9BACT|nr:MAG: Periplasmic thiol:disulfide interchange protein DsbA [Candidatus Uhrbacteria bacterium GW2011_GWC2_41_11]KKR97706.1 MAG: Periplasmic thiol:disulfide interchange protein DsbA [Candidatus Uhrbacteria bacterium GW2011_GWF2_41_16]